MTELLDKTHPEDNLNKMYFEYPDDPLMSRMDIFPFPKNTTDSDVSDEFVDSAPTMELRWPTTWPGRREATVDLGSWATLIEFDEITRRPVTDLLNLGRAPYEGDFAELAQEPDWVATETEKIIQAHRAEIDALLQTPSTESIPEDLIASTSLAKTAEAPKTVVFATIPEQARPPQPEQLPTETHTPTTTEVPRIPDQPNRHPVHTYEPGPILKPTQAMKDGKIIYPEIVKVAIKALPPKPSFDWRQAAARLPLVGRFIKQR